MQAGAIHKLRVRIDKILRIFYPDFVDKFTKYYLFYSKIPSTNQATFTGHILRILHQKILCQFCL